MKLEPRTRMEKFLAKIAGQDVDTPTPITREEAFLNSIKCRGDSSAPYDWNAAEGEPGYILNRPFGIEITPDLVFTEEDIANATERIGAGVEAYIKVSDRVLTVDEINRMSVIFRDDSVHDPITYTDTTIDDSLHANMSMICVDNGSKPIGVVVKQETQLTPDIVFSPGLWLFDYTGAGDMRILSVIIHGGETVYPIDPKFLPTHLQFGDEEIRECILPETTVHCKGPEGGMFAATFELIPGVEPGKRYIVSVDGTEYESVAVKATSGVLLGNQMGKGGADNGEPYTIVVSEKEGKSGFVAVYDTVEQEHTISVSSMKVNTKPIDPKFLPAHLQFGEEQAFDPIVWDGTTEGKETEYDGMFVKIYDKYIPITDKRQILGILIRGIEDGKELEQLLPVDRIGNLIVEEHGWYMGEVLFASDGEWKIGVDQESTLALSEGVWMVNMGAMGMPGFLGATVLPGETIVPISRKVLPSATIGYVSNTPDEFAASIRIEAYPLTDEGATYEEIVDEIEHGKLPCLCCRDTTNNMPRFYYLHHVKRESSGNYYAYFYSIDHNRDYLLAHVCYLALSGNTKSLVQRDTREVKVYKQNDPVIIRSSTNGSTKRFQITVDDSGTVTGVEVAAE